MDFQMVQDKNIILTEHPESQITDIAEFVVHELIKRDMHISIAESCTGGMVAACITDISGASNVFECGIVSYSNDVKKRLLDVDKSWLDSAGPVNPETAVMMATGVKEKGQADIGIGITGVAGPGPDGDHPEGEIYISLATNCKSYVIKLMTRTENQRDYNRQLAVLNALNLTKLFLENNLQED